MYKKYVALVLMMYCYSCEKDKGSLPVKGCNPPAQISYQQHIQPIFNTYCINAGCHSGASPGGNLNLEPSASYAQLMKSGSGYINTSQPNFSLLYSQMNSSSNPMPKTGKLDDCTIGLILEWIQQGAKNN